jgi:integrase
MATLTNDPQRGYQIRFYNSEGKRRKITIGNLPEADALHYKRQLSALEKVQREGREPSKELEAWLQELGPKILEKLQKAGMIELEEPSVLTIGELCERFLAERTDVKPTTQNKMKLAATSFLDFIHPDTPIDSITKGQAQSYRRHLIKSEFKENTIRKKCQHASQILGMAVDYEWINRNPFSSIPKASTRPKKKAFIDHPTYARVVASCPHAEWVLLVALSRFGGLRVPSEALSLRWNDINWEQNEIRVPSPKTEHHEGKDQRFIPLWEELRQPLMDVQEQSKDGSEFVINRARPARVRGLDPKDIDWAKINLGQMLRKIVRKAGLNPWPSIWHAMRASCQTELTETFPLHVVCSWLGNSEKIADRHYLQTTDSHHERAINLKRLSESGTNSGPIAGESGTISGPLSEPSADHAEPQTTPHSSGNNAKNEDCLANEGAPRLHPAGLEPATSGSVNRCSIQLS